MQGGSNMDFNKRKLDIEKLIKGLDITPTMYRNALEKYQNIGKYLIDNGLDVDIFPQGSFSIGTVVRPYNHGQETSYDLDFVILHRVEKAHTNPKNEKYLPYYKLMENETYKNIISKEEYEKCWTLEYSKLSDVKFNIDIVPAVREEKLVVEELISLGIERNYAQKAIAITNKNNIDYSWRTSNPEAYKEWFDLINKPFMEYNRNERRIKIMNENLQEFSSIEDIPSVLDHSALQRVIQILKRHRDVYFSKKNQENNKPISAIITTITAEIAKDAQNYLSIVELLQYVITDFGVYSKWQKVDELFFESRYVSKKVIMRKNMKWVINNPVNLKDNLADGWNTNPSKADYFFEWVEQLKEDFIDSFAYGDDLFFAMLENGFGTRYVKMMMKNDNHYLDNSQEILSTPKHWKMHER